MAVTPAIAAAAAAAAITTGNCATL